MRKNSLKNQWPELRNSVKKLWGKFTDDEVIYIHGKEDRLVELLQKKYGYTKNKAQQAVEDFVSHV